MKAVIPTGGNGTRMRPLTFSSNKHFIPIANKPLIFYPIETIANAGIKEVCITYNPGQLEMVKSFLGDGEKWGLTLTYVLQEKPAGLANIFQVCEEALQGDDFVLHLGDNIFTGGIKEAYDHFEKNKPEGLVLMVHHKDNKRLGVPFFDDNGRLIKYVEKPENPPHDFAIPGLYFFSNTVFKCFREDPIKPSERGELEISAPYQWLIDHGFRVDVLEYKDVWMDPGKFDDWIETSRYMLENKLEEGRSLDLGEDVRVEGKVSIGKGCNIANSILRGPLIIGDGVKIINSTVGPYISLGDDVVIEDSLVENSVILKGTSIRGVGNKISTSLIGADTEISGNGGTVELFVGEKCKIKL